MYFIVSLAGLGEIGMVVGSLSLVTSVSVPVHVRGAVAGVSSFCGAIGILVNTKLGGYLFDAWTEGAPFFLMAVGHALCTILAVGVTTMDVIKLKREQQSHLDAPPEKIGVLQALKNLQVSQEKAKHEESSPSLLS